MVNARRLGRLGLLTVGLGIGLGVAATPGIASADTADPFTFDFSNLAISFNGMSLLHEGSATANTTAGTGDFAFADGAHADASATGGFLDFAGADGTNALAEAGGSSGSNFDSAVDVGNNTLVGQDGPNGALAGAGSLYGLTGNGSFDRAIDFGNNIGSGNGPDAVDGNFDSALQSGNVTGNDIGAFSGIGNNDLASVLGGTSSTSAGGDYFDPSIVGNNDIASVFDPFGTVGSTATAGANTLDAAPGNFDLAAVFGDGFIGGTGADATGANFLIDILPSLASLF
jgi:hypothetical protein